MGRPPTFPSPLTRGSFSATCARYRILWCRARLVLMNLPQIGDVFHGHYRIDDALGRGGFGAVFAAADLRNGRAVALKVLFPDRQDSYEPGTRARFEREVMIVAELKSPYVVDLYEHGTTADGLLFAAFERVPGVDLTEHVARVGRMQPAEIVHVLRQLLIGLREAHARGLLHRDIKPDNIRVFSVDGDPLRVKLLDFGLARASDDGSPSVTKTGELLGTPRYMSPEQLLGQPVSPASDIYSLGMVAWEMLGGADALAGNRWGDQLDRLRTGAIVAAGDVPDPQLSMWLQRMTAREPERRFPSAAAALAALDAMASGAAPQVRTPAMATQLGARRGGTSDTTRLVAIASAAVALIAILAVMVGWMLQNSPAPRATATTPQMRAAGAPRGIVRGTAPPPLRGAPPPAAAAKAPDVGKPMADGCAAGPVETGTSRLPGDVWLHVPANYTPGKPHPILILAHAAGISARQFLDDSGFIPRADADGVVILAPSGRHDLDIAKAVGVRVPGWDEDFGDVAWIRDVVDDVATQVCLDRSRVWVVGHAKGGRLVNALSCEDWVTAVAANSFSLDANEQHKYCPDKPKPALYVLPLSTGHVPAAGGEACTLRQKPSFEVMESWIAERNRCSSSRPSRTRKPHGECYAWDCETPFEACHVEGGHPWPGTQPRQGLLDLKGCDGAPQKFDATGEIWEFLQRAPPLTLKGPAP